MINATGRATEATPVIVTTHSGGSARADYLEALDVCARAGRELSAATWQALYALNAAYYLRQYLPAVTHSAIVAASAAALIAAVRSSPAGPASRRLAAQRHDAVYHRRRLLDWIERGRGGMPALVAAQHVLEVAPELSRLLQTPLLCAAAHVIVDHREERCEQSGEESRQRSGTHQADAQRDRERRHLHDWAASNARPARQDEIIAWAGCIARREPLRLLEQALASGLAFGTLLDALVVAAAVRTLQSPRDAGGGVLVAAHAVRRLTEIAGAPTIGAWLTVAGYLSEPTRYGEPPPRSHPTAPDLALIAVQSGDAALIQAAEAALVESESLSENLAPLLLQALDALLQHAESAPAQHSGQEKQENQMTDALHARQQTPGAPSRNKNADNKGKGR